MGEASIVTTEYIRGWFFDLRENIAYDITYRCDIVLSKELELFLALHVN